MLETTQVETRTIAAIRAGRKREGIGRFLQATRTTAKTKPDFSHSDKLKTQTG
jgi:hypothetical protein